MNCPICKNLTNNLFKNVPDRHYGIKGEWDLNRCSNLDCGHIFQNPIPTEQELINYYGKTYYSVQKPKTDFSFNLKKNRGVYLKLNYLYHYLGYKNLEGDFSKIMGIIGRIISNKPFDYDTPKYIEGGKILDFGSGSGDTVSFLKFLGWDAAGIDFNKQASIIGQGEGLNIIYGSIDELRSNHNYYDNIIASHSVEHVTDVNKLLNDFYYALKEGGSLSIEVPNGDSTAFKKFGRYYYYLGMPLHIHLFTIKSLSLLCKMAGFKDIKVSSYNKIKTKVASMDLVNRLKTNGERSFTKNKSKISKLYLIKALINNYNFINFKKNNGDCLVMRMKK